MKADRTTTHFFFGTTFSLTTSPWKIGKKSLVSLISAQM